MTNAAPRRDPLQAVVERAAVVGDVEQIHRPREIQIAVRIERADELVGMGFQIGLHLEVDAEALSGAAVGCPFAPEALPPLGRRAVRDHAELAREPHALHWRLVERVLAVTPGRIVANQLALQRAQGDRERLRAHRRRNQQHAVHALRVADRVGEGGHAAHRRPGHGMKALYPQALHHRLARLGHVLQRQHREVEPIAAPANRIRGSRAGGAEAAAEGVDADHEVARGVDGLVRADHVLPPACGSVLGRRRRVGGRREAGEEQHRVVRGRRELAPGLVGDGRRLDDTVQHREGSVESDEAAGVSHRSNVPPADSTSSRAAPPRHPRCTCRALSACAGA